MGPIKQEIDTDNFPVRIEGPDHGGSASTREKGTAKRGAANTEPPKSKTPPSAAQNKIIVKTEPDSERITVCALTADLNGGSVKRSTESAETTIPSKRFKDRRSRENSTESTALSPKTLSSVSPSDSVIHTTEASAAIGVQRTISRPAEYIMIRNPLYQCNPEAPEDSHVLEELFPKLESAWERELCTQIAGWDLENWIQYGDKLSQEYNALLGELVRQRIELSYKFEVITDKINERAEALTLQGKLVDDKMQKIKSLGKEILDII